MILSCLTLWLTVARVGVAAAFFLAMAFASRSAFCLYLADFDRAFLVLYRSVQVFWLLWADDRQIHCVLDLLCPQDQPVFRKEADQVLLPSALFLSVCSDLLCRSLPFLLLLLLLLFSLFLALLSSLCCPGRTLTLEDIFLFIISSLLAPLLSLCCLGRTLTLEDIFLLLVSSLLALLLSLCCLGRTRIPEGFSLLLLFSSDPFLF